MQHPDQVIPKAIVKLKSDYVRAAKGRTFLSEVLPTESSKRLPIESTIIQALHTFARSNELYVKSYRQLVDSISCLVYEADINRFWLSSKKYDSCYQPFYPTWLLSAYALAKEAKSLGYKELVDIGSGDGRIAYCASLLGMKSYGIEIDGELAQLQKNIAAATGATYFSIEADATGYGYDQLGLSRPMFFISGLPEMGEMLARSVLGKILSNRSLKGNSGFNFMGSHVMKRMSRDHTDWGWGKVMSDFDLDLAGTITLPTYWTTEEPVDTAYVYAVSA
jgi:hypothetical protein